MADDQVTSTAVEGTVLADSVRESVVRATFDLPLFAVIRERYGDDRPLAGARIALFCPPTPYFAALADVMAGLGAMVKWAADERGDARSRIQAPVAGSESAGLVPRRHQPWSWDDFHSAFDWDDGGTANLIVDKDGSAARLIHWGVAVEGGAAASPSNAEDVAVYDAIRRRLVARPASYGAIATNIVGLAEYTALGVERLRELENAVGLMFPVIDVSTGGLSGQAPNRDRVAIDKLSGLLGRLLLAQIELFSNGANYAPGLHRFQERLTMLSNCEMAATTPRSSPDRSSMERPGSSSEAVRGH